MWYLSVSATVSCYWLYLFLTDKSTPKNHLPSWLIILVAPLFWPLVLPASVIELATKSLPNEEHIEVYENQPG